MARTVIPYSLGLIGSVCHAAIHCSETRSLVVHAGPRLATRTNYDQTVQERHRTPTYTGLNDVVHHGSTNDCHRLNNVGHRSDTDGQTPVGHQPRVPDTLGWPFLDTFWTDLAPIWLKTRPECGRPLATRPTRGIRQVPLVGCLDPVSLGYPTGATF